MPAEMFESLEKVKQIIINIGDSCLSYVVGENCDKIESDKFRTGIENFYIMKDGKVILYVHQNMPVIINFSDQF